MFCYNCGKELADGAKFCCFCGTKMEEDSTTPEVVTQEEPATYTENMANAFEPTTAAPELQPVEEYQPEPQPVSQPIPQPVAQPQPVEPSFYASSTPYQAPQMGMPPKKNNNVPIIIAIVLIVLLLIAGGLVCICSFVTEPSEDSVLSVFDLTKEEEKETLSSKLEDEFLDLVAEWDDACLETSTSSFEDAFPDYALDYIIESYGADDAESLLAFMNEEYYKPCGDDAEVKEECYINKKITKLDDLADCFDELFDESVEIEKAYVITCTSTIKGDDDKEVLTDNYLFYSVDDEWNIIIIPDGNKKDFGL